MIEKYYRTKLSPFLSDYLLEAILSGEKVRLDQLTNDMVLSKQDRNSIVMLSVFLNDENKVIIDEGRDISFRKIKDIEGFDLITIQPHVVESISEFEFLMQNLAIIMSDFNNETLFENYFSLSSKVAPKTDAKDLFEFFQEYDKNHLKQMIDKAREASEETEDSIKTKMILAKLKTRVNENNITLGSIIKLQNKDGFNNVQDLQNFINYN